MTPKQARSERKKERKAILKEIAFVSRKWGSGAKNKTPNEWSAIWGGHMVLDILVGRILDREEEP